jgi:hypothetical protein
MEPGADDWRHGYPIDLRSEPLRRRAAEGPFLDFEYRAARVVARATGQRVFLQDDNSEPRTPDLRIEYPGWRGIGEVVIITDPGTADLYSSFGKGELRFTDHRLGWQWWIDYSPAIDRRNLRELLVDVLVQMETDGEMYASLVPIDHVSPGDGARRLQELGVVAIATNTNRRDGPGEVIGLPGAVDIPREVDIDAVSDWLDRELASDLMLRKSEKLMARPGYSERHLFIGVSWSAPSEVLSLLRTQAVELPRKPPTLPTGVTHLWLWDAFFPGRAIAWWPQRMWFDVAHAWVTD